MKNKWEHPFFGETIDNDMYGKFNVSSIDGFYGYRIARHVMFPYYLRLHEGGVRHISRRKIIKMRTKK